MRAQRGGEEGGAGAERKPGYGVAGGVAFADGDDGDVGVGFGVGASGAGVGVWGFLLRV